jgi:eukaryotic-like serine/threonine-protein kinase
MLSRDPALRPAMPHAERALKALESAPEDSAPADAVPAEPEPEQPAAKRTTPLAAAAPIPADRSYADGPAPTPPASPEPAAPAPASPEPAPQKGFALGTHRRAVIAVLIAALLLALGGWGLSVALSGHSTTTKAGATTPSSHAAASSAAPAASSQPSKTSGPKASASPPASATAASTAAQSVADQLTTTIVDYYHLVPNNLTQAWPWMTPDYQQNHAGGWIGYQSFWSKIQGVTVSDVTATPPSTVTATIDYSFKDGSSARERTRFGMFYQQGRWLIASSSVVG